MTDPTAIELHLLRHAHAGDPDAWQGDDAARPLSKKGRRQAERMGAFLAGVGFTTDAIISSPKVRARETAELVAEAIGTSVLLDDRLANGLTIDQLDEALTEAGDPVRPVVVGHDPSFSEILAVLCGASEIPMRKGAMARVDIRRPLRPGGGTLRWLIPPDLLEDSRSAG